MNPILWSILFFCSAFLAAVLEVFLPTGGLFAALAAGFLITSIVFAFKISFFVGSLYTLFICLIFPLFIWAALRLWPKTWFGRLMLLTPEDDPALVPDKQIMSLQELVGMQGIAKSKMLLGGLIEIEGHRYNAVSNSEPIDTGEPIRVMRIEGTSIIVRRIDSLEITDDLAQPMSLADPFAE